MAVEIKRRGEIDGVEQLARYIERLDLDGRLRPVRGLLAAQQIKPQAQVVAAARGIQCVEVDYEDLTGRRGPLASRSSSTRRRRRRSAAGAACSGIGAAALGVPSTGADVPCAGLGIPSARRSENASATAPGFLCTSASSACQRRVTRGQVRDRTPPAEPPHPPPVPNSAASDHRPSDPGAIKVGPGCAGRCRSGAPTRPGRPAPVDPRPPRAGAPSAE